VQRKKSVGFGPSAAAASSFGGIGGNSSFGRLYPLERTSSGGSGSSIVNRKVGGHHGIMLRGIGGGGGGGAATGQAGTRGGGVGGGGVGGEVDGTGVPTKESNGGGAMEEPSDRRSGVGNSASGAIDSGCGVGMQLGGGGGGAGGGGAIPGGDCMDGSAGCLDDDNSSRMDVMMNGNDDSTAGGGDNGTVDAVAGINDGDHDIDNTGMGGGDRGSSSGNLRGVDCSSSLELDHSSRRSRRGNKFDMNFSSSSVGALEDGYDGASEKGRGENDNLEDDIASDIDLGGEETGPLLMGVNVAPPGPALVGQFPLGATTGMVRNRHSFNSENATAGDLARSLGSIGTGGSSCSVGTGASGGTGSDGYTPGVQSVGEAHHRSGGGGGDGGGDSREPTSRLPSSNVSSNSSNLSGTIGMADRDSAPIPSDIVISSSTCNTDWLHRGGTMNETNVMSVGNTMMHDGNSSSLNAVLIRSHSPASNSTGNNTHIDSVYYDDADDNKSNTAASGHMLR